MPFLCSSQRRTLFLKPDRRPKKVDLDPGLRKMLDLNESASMQARPPPAKDLAQAFKAFFRSKHQIREPLEEIQAMHAFATFQHLQRHNAEQDGFGLSLNDLQTAMDALVQVPEGNVSIHHAFAKALFEEIKQRRETNPSNALISGLKDLLPYVSVICQTGNTMEAQALVEKHWKGHPGRTGRRLAARLLEGFAKENKEEELLRVLVLMEENGVDFDSRVHQVITKHYALKNDVEATKKWFRHPIAHGETPTPYTNAHILRFCLRNNELEWGSAVFRSILETNPDKKTWDIIFQWAAAMGKGVDEVEQMMRVMVRRNPDDETLRPDIETINGLVEFANSRNDPYTAERYISLGQRWNMEPNAETYILQMDYRIKVGDIAGAKATYEVLRAEDVPQNEDLPVIFRLIQALCAAKHTNFYNITSIVADITERKVRLDPDTVVALCLLHLRRDEPNEVVDLLNSHTFHYSLDQRVYVRNALLAFCLDRDNSTARAWDAYQIFRQVFDETPLEIRSLMMREFFDRRRPDMACHIFSHMRHHFNPERRPTAETYIECFEGIAGAADLEGLQMIHNTLKLDDEVEPCTRLYNALMLAYTACDMPFRSLEFWDDITNSREGPTYNSIQIVFEACQAAPFGDRHARPIWQKLKKMGVQPTKEIYAAYAGALARQGHLEEARKVVDGMEKDAGFEVNYFLCETRCKFLSYEVVWVVMLTYSPDWGHCTMPQRGKADKTKLKNGLLRPTQRPGVSWSS
ncbi:hypothetical protein FGG08_005282 [Glutinoglossum americanum]|uniref:Pentatricopeptide repeat-containing protein n=1 Tax=Glutinoglossum americanum TaxID=1670608 RepID=A0A9P8I9S6_9PEZI|nr:hypothetical protein FGG08_005282 [Glutinoglossum americanum]